VLIVLYLDPGELRDVHFACVILEDVDVVFLVLVAQQILDVLVVDLEVAEVELVAAFEHPLEKVLETQVGQPLLLLRRTQDCVGFTTVCCSVSHQCDIHVFLQKAKFLSYCCLEY
jgi:hypothetical protein